MTETMLVPAHTLPHRTPVELITLARRGLSEARSTGTHSERYATAHLAALRAAAAMLAIRARPDPVHRRKRATSVWDLLILVAPELTDWAELFAAGAAKRSAAEAGIARITAAEADQTMRQAGYFVDLVQDMLGLAGPPVLPAPRVP